MLFSRLSMTDVIDKQTPRCKSNEISNYAIKPVRKKNSLRHLALAISYKRTYWFFPWLLLTSSRLYVTRLPSDISKLWRFHRGFNFPPRPLFEIQTWTKRIHHILKFSFLITTFVLQSPRLPRPLFLPSPSQPAFDCKYNTMSTERRRG